MRPAIVGIDLGTTNTLVARKTPGDSAPIRVVELAQFVAPGTVEARALLPSALFASLPGELASDPWNDAPWLIGALARTRGEQVPGRFVSSAKSWLSHSGVDRLAPILPWGADAADTSLPRVSPVEASERILAHARRAHDAAFAEAALAEQSIVLTVPASFDEVARELTVHAATRAGLTVRLLEEPLAAFYDYLSRQATTELDALVGDTPEALVLVCDVGGGTTDLTLVHVRRESDDLAIERVAVGRHLLLGGDNMDLAVAHAVETELTAGSERLSPPLFAELLLACRRAKERLLAASAPDHAEIRVLSRGSSLIGNTLAANLERGTVERVVLDGFFPDIAAAAPTSRGGLVTFGLPYERDPAITRHVAAFLRRHALAPGSLRAVLLNGGVFASPAVRRRLLDALAQFTGAPLVELTSPDPDLAVARGAVAFGLALEGEGPRIGGGSARGYYAGIASGGERRAVCVVPRGAREGERHVVAVPGLALVVGQPVRFDLFSSDAALHSPGEVVSVDANLDALPPLTLALDPDDGAAGSRIPVRLEGELTAAGTVDVACVETRSETHLPPSASTRAAPPERTATSTPPPRRFRLAFDLRAAPKKVTEPPRPRLSDAKALAAFEKIDRVFGKGRADSDPRDARHLVRDLEQVLGERANWNTEVARSLFDRIAPEARARRRSVEHERVLWSLIGFCGRPGYGHPLDEKRVGKMVPLFTELVVAKDEARVWQQFWIAWRRLSGGLGERMQTEIRDVLDPFLSTDEDKRKKRKGVQPRAAEEMLELASSLERVAPERRADLGRWVLERTWTDRDPRLWAALGRIGARVPTYASVHFAVPPHTIERWLDHLLREKWDAVTIAARTAVQLARVTGDPARDVSEALRREIAKRLERTNSPPEWAAAVLDFVPVEERDRSEFFGESLPSGLELGAT